MPVCNVWTCSRHPWQLHPVTKAAVTEAIGDALEANAAEAKAAEDARKREQQSARLKGLCVCVCTEPVMVRVGLHAPLATRPPWLWHPPFVGCGSCLRGNLGVVAAVVCVCVCACVCVRSRPAARHGSYGQAAGSVPERPGR